MAPNPGEFTSQEKGVMELLGQASTLFAQIPAQHPADLPEFVHAVHAAQNIVSSRAAARANPNVLTGGPR